MVREGPKTKKIYIEADTRSLAKMRTSSLLPRSVGVSAMPVRPTFVRKPPSASPVISAAVTGPVYSGNSLLRPHTTAARSASFAPSGPFLRAAVYDDPLFRPENQLDWTAGTKELVDESEWRDSLGEKLSKQEAKKRQKAAVPLCLVNCAGR